MAILTGAAVASAETSSAPGSNAPFNTACDFFMSVSSMRAINRRIHAPAETMLETGLAPLQVKSGHRPIFNGHAILWLTLRAFLLPGPWHAGCRNPNPACQNGETGRPSSVRDLHAAVPPRMIRAIVVAKRPPLEPHDKNSDHC
ncbi:hypothetical protein GCM10009108_17020 [Castellaniella ginsengisoli]|uniref:Uncharacterized protein n=1 Tax=Castellaniella ginsengisoli TaxID=546114 RepID=A0ABN1KYI2_9BURK